MAGQLFFEPASVFMLWVRKASAKRFCSLSFESIALAFGSALADADEADADEDAGLPDAVSFVVDALAVDLVTGG